ncbi:MAG: hypothetical protein QOH93_832 [Chloroflexia bacterium]|jgi:serine/threonine protein phosphatase PrpC|nr:hypothetical protein [Chloroflexia bacterium]
MPDTSKVGNVDTFRWLGSDEMHLDKPGVFTCGRVRIGLYGGNTEAGATKNEDAALVLCSGDGEWEFAAVVDAHYSSESAQLILDALSLDYETMIECMERPVSRAFDTLERHVLELFASPDFRAKCRLAVGEASCLVVARKDRFLWWLSVGDCVAYALHRRLAGLGQFALNQRSFFEWIGHHNTFDLPVPSYTRGVKELLPGRTVLVLTTDGLLECGNRSFEDPRFLYFAFTYGSDSDLADNVLNALSNVHGERGRDSATVIAWSHSFGQDETW